MTDRELLAMMAATLWTDEVEGPEVSDEARASVAVERAWLLLEEINLYVSEQNTTVIKPRD